MPPRSSGSAGRTSTRSAPRRAHGIPIVGVTEGESLPYVLDTNLVDVSARPRAAGRRDRGGARRRARDGRPRPRRAAAGAAARGRRRADRRDRTTERPGRRRDVGPRHRPADPDAQPARGSSSRIAIAGGTRALDAGRSCRSSLGVAGAAYRLAPCGADARRPAACRRSSSRSGSRVRRDARGGRGGPPPLSPEPGPSDRGPRLSFNRKEGSSMGLTSDREAARAPADRGGGRLVRVRGRDEGPERHALRRDRAVGLGAAAAAPADRAVRRARLGSGQRGGLKPLRMRLASLAGNADAFTAFNPPSRAPARCEAARAHL